MSGSKTAQRVLRPPLFAISSLIVPLCHDEPLGWFEGLETAGHRSLCEIHGLMQLSTETTPKGKDRDRTEKLSLKESQ